MVDIGTLDHSGRVCPSLGLIKAGIGIQAKLFGRSL